MARIELTRWDPASLAEAAKDLLRFAAEDHHPALGGGVTSASSYDTAWVAMVRKGKDGPLAFPESLEWIVQHQAEDGSWGGVVPILSTLACLLALTRYLAHPSPPVRDAGRVRAAADLARSFLDGALQRWCVGAQESVGFEMVAPTLLRHLSDEGIHFEFGAKAELMALFEKKMALTPFHILYDPASKDGTTLAHSLEAFIDVLDFDRIHHHQGPSGQYGGSPSSTAAVLMKSSAWNEAAEGWLRHVMSRYAGSERGGVPMGYPLDIFQAAWIVSFLQVTGGEIDGPQLSLILDRFEGSLKAHRGVVACTAVDGLCCDADDTGMAIAVLNRAGRKPDVKGMVASFEDKEHFRCFQMERIASPTANAHVLAALLTHHDATEHRPRIDKIVRYLSKTRHEEGYWMDKWHISPYYAVSCAMEALCLVPGLDLSVTIEWLLRTQDAGGGWGDLGADKRPTVEETAFAMTALKSAQTLGDLPQSTRERITRGLLAGGEFLEARLPLTLSDLERDKLWMGKELYAFPVIVMAAVVAALSPAPPPRPAADRVMLAVEQSTLWCQSKLPGLRLRSKVVRNVAAMLGAHQSALDVPSLVQLTNLSMLIYAMDQLYDEDDVDPAEADAFLARVRSTLVDGEPPSPGASGAMFGDIERAVYSFLDPFRGGPTASRAPFGRYFYWLIESMHLRRVWLEAGGTRPSEEEFLRVATLDIGYLPVGILSYRLLGDPEDPALIDEVIKSGFHPGARIARLANDIATHEKDHAEGGALNVFVYGWSEDDARRHIQARFDDICRLLEDLSARRLQVRSLEMFHAVAASAVRMYASGDINID